MKPTATYEEEFSYKTLDFYSPSIYTGEYAAFPIVSLKQWSGSLITDNDFNINSSFDVYISSSIVTEESDANEGLLEKVINKYV
jgi:hypothetical protein